MKPRSYRWRFGVLAAACLVAAAGATLVARAATTPSREEGLAAFEAVKAVLQHPRCQNCHIPGDAPLQFDAGTPHAMNVLRGPEGKGSPGLACSTCHGEENAPASFGPHAPPGAPSWSLPPPQHRMVFIGMASGPLCKNLKDEKQNGGKNLDALLDHMANDKLVGWGWNPGPGRAPVPTPRADVVAKMKVWIAAGAPCAD